MHTQISNILHSNGYECYYVGGYVRDSILGLKSSDIDLCTNAKPEELLELFKDFSIKQHGKSFNVIVIEGIEVATYRKDVYFGNSDKNCEIIFANSISEDLARRDLRINSIAKCTKTGCIIDPFDGMKDLFTKKFSFVGDPYDRIAEDPNRILRAFRFAAKFNADLTEETKDAIRNSKHLFQYIAKERIYIELMKTMKIKKASIFFKLAHECEILELIFPSLAKAVDHDHGPHHNESVFTHMMMAGDYMSTKCSILKLTAYLHDIGKVHTYDPVERTFIGHEFVGAGHVYRELKNLSFPNEIINMISQYVRFHMRNPLLSEKAARKLLKDLNENGLNYKAHTRLKLADRYGNLKKTPFKFSEIKKIINNFEVHFHNEPTVFSIKDLAINGNILIDYFSINPGRIIGDILRFALEAVYDEKCPNNKEELLKFIEEKFI